MNNLTFARQMDQNRRHVLGISDAEERRMAIALLAAQIGVFEFEPQTGRAFWDDRIRELWGVPAGEDITYDTVIAQVHPDDQAMHDALTAKAIDPAGDGHMDMEYRLLPRGGEPMRWIHVIADCHFENGRAVRLVGTVQDVTVRRMSEERNKLLMHELEHRVKNTLATILAVVKMSARKTTDIASYIRVIEDRLHSLSNSHDMLRRNDWSSVDLHEIVRQEADGFLEGSDDDRLDLTGEAITVPAASVLIVTMAVHELLTNASKHGALSPAGGRVSAHTEIIDGNATFVWEEALQVPMDVQEARSEGFGSLLLRQILPAELRGNVTYDHRPTGVRFEMQFPLA